MWNENPLIMYYFNSPSSAKTPAVQLKRQVTVSPTHKSIEDEVIYLRSQNKLLNNALKAVKNTASEKLCKSYELVWYARNRSKCRRRSSLMIIASRYHRSLTIHALHLQRATHRIRYLNGLIAQKSIVAISITYIVLTETSTMALTVVCLRHLVCSKTMRMSRTSIGTR